MSDEKYAKFIEELRALCTRHEVTLAVSPDDSNCLQVYRNSGEDPLCFDIEDMTGEEHTMRHVINGVEYIPARSGPYTHVVVIERLECVLSWHISKMRAERAIVNNRNSRMKLRIEAINNGTAS